MLTILIGLIGISGPYRNIILRNMLENIKCVEFRPFDITAIKKTPVYLGLVVDKKIWGGGIIVESKQIFSSEILLRTDETISNIKDSITKLHTELRNSMLDTISNKCNDEINKSLMEALSHYSKFYVINRINKGILTLLSSDEKAIKIQFEMYAWIFENIEKYDIPIEINRTPQSLEYLNDTQSKTKKNLAIIKKILQKSTILSKYSTIHM